MSSAIATVISVATGAVMHFDPEKPSGQYLGLICAESLTCHNLNSNPGHFGGSTTFILVSCGESCLLVSWCTGGRCSKASSDEDCDRSRRPSAEDRGWSGIGRVLGGRTIGRSGDAMCGLHRARGDEEHGFVGSASKSRSTVVSGLASKPLGWFLPVWPQNRWHRVSRFGPQTQQLQFGDLGLKITTMVSWFGPQNQVGYILLVAPQNQREDEFGVGHVSRSSSLLCVEASRARVSQSRLKSSVDVMAGGARGTIAEVM
jgi:hypothetical protein